MLSFVSNHSLTPFRQVSYKLEGRLRSGWIIIHQGDLPWKNSNNFPRNKVLGVDISSTYISGDNALNYTEVSFHNYDYNNCGSSPLQFDYRGTINSTQSGLTCQSWSAQWQVGGNHNYCRNPNNQPGGAWCYTTNADMSWEYCDVPVCKDDPGTLKQYAEYKITWTATRTPTSLFLQLAEIEIPGLLGVEHAHQYLPYEGEYVPTVLIGSSDVKLVNAYSAGAPVDWLSVDRSTSKFQMSRTTSVVTPGSYLSLVVIYTFHCNLTVCSKLLLSSIKGIMISPSHGQMSVVTGLRIYMANNNPGADPVKYLVSGRLMSGANVKNSVNGLCWSVDEQYGSILMGNANCSSNDSRQKFIMNELGEIRVKSKPGSCLDHRYGYYPDRYTSSRFIPCFSDDPDYQESSYSYIRGECDLCAYIIFLNAFF